MVVAWIQQCFTIHCSDDDCHSERTAERVVACADERERRGSGLVSVFHGRLASRIRFTIEINPHSPSVSVKSAPNNARHFISVSLHAPPG
jgi:hypothetical protein